MIEVKIDMTGWVMNEHGVSDSLIVVQQQVDDYVSPQGKHQAMWSCKCLCGSDKEFVAIGVDIRRGKVLSCGCVHYEQLVKRNKDGFKGNAYDLSGEFGIGWTSNTNAEFYFDLDDYDLIKNYTWMEDINDKNYHVLKARNPETGKLIKFHHVLGCERYDHIDRNPLNNRRNNLRKATTTENIINRNRQRNNKSGFIGVHWGNSRNRWVATININGRQKQIGYFHNKEDAIRARLEAETKYYGDFAPQHNLFEQYGIVTNL